MLDQNSDRLWQVIIVLLIGATMIATSIFVLPEIFGNMIDNYAKVSGKAVRREKDQGNIILDSPIAKHNPDVYSWHDGNLIIKKVDDSSGSQGDWILAELKPNKTYQMTFSEPLHNGFKLPEYSTNFVWRSDNLGFTFKTGSAGSLVLKGKFLPIGTEYPYTVNVQLMEI